MLKIKNVIGQSKSGPEDKYTEIALRVFGIVQTDPEPPPAIGGGQVRRVIQTNAVSGIRRPIPWVFGCLFSFRESVGRLRGNQVPHIAWG